MQQISKQQAFDFDPKELQQTSFTGNVYRKRDRNTKLFFIIEEGKENILDFSQGTVKVL